MPTLTVKKTKRDFDTIALSKIFHDLAKASFDLHTAAPLIVVAVEHATAMPKQGVTSTFRTGYGFGVIVGIVSALHLPVEWIRPNAWKAKMMAGLPKEKQASILRASQLFPGSVELLTPKRGELTKQQAIGRADALLIAEHCRRSWRYAKEIPF